LRSGRAFEGLPAGIARACDGFLDFVVLAFAAWTVVYHVCLVLEADAMWAAIAWAIALVPCGLLAARSDPEPGSNDRTDAPRRRDLNFTALAGVQVAAALGSAALFAYTAAGWWTILGLWLLAAAAAVALTSLPGVGAPETTQPLARKGQHWLGTAVALAWAAGLGVLSLFIVRSAFDDTYYVRLAAWVAEHGEFPLRDTIFSDQVFPAIIYPPLSSFEAFVGTVAGIIGVSGAGLFYLVVAPVASALGVLALWRLYRGWQVPMVGIALSVALVFLLMDAPSHRALGDTILSRIWHGKVVLLAVLVPLLLVFLQEYRERPTRRWLVLLAAAGAAGVGLTSTAVFVVPVVAFAALAPAAIRAPRQAAAAFVATTVYPLGAGLVAAAVGQRTASGDFYVRPDHLAEFVLSEGMLAFVAVGAMLIGPVLIPERVPGQITALTALLVGLLFAPPITEALFDFTGFSRVLWRLLWAIPIAALVGVVAVRLSARARSPAVRVLPAILLSAAFFAWGAPLWSSSGLDLASKPSWKRPPFSVHAARKILAHADSGAVVLAPQITSQSIATMSGDVYPVAPRIFYALALDDPDAYAQERVVLQAFAEEGLEGQIERLNRPPEPDEVIRALGLVGVDIACVEDNADTRRVLRDAGYSPIESVGSLICMRAPEDGAET
jgi:hypothetical protein